MIKIREATKDDITSIVDYSRAMAMETEGIELEGATLTRGVTRLFSSPEKGFYLLAEVNGTVAGQLLITFEWSDWRDGDFWWIQSVYVDPEFRGRGVYRTLHDEILRRAHEQGEVCGVRLYVHKENRPAQEVYKKLGMGVSPYTIMESYWPGSAGKG